jgi:Protein of unknown function (DUF3306)
MTDREGFVARWSRLKISQPEEPSEGVPKLSPDAASLTPPSETPAVDATSDADLAGNAFDAATLPSIESITLDTDIRAFLQTGVPEELKTRALRRAWSTDPAIRDFIGIAENQWDFTDPNGIPGFGPLRATDNVAALVAQALGQFKNISDTIGKLALTDKGVGQLEQPTQHPIEQTEHVAAQIAAVHPEPVGMVDNDPGGERKSHGGALPR